MRISADGLIAGKSYAVRIRSVGADGKPSDWSPKLNFTTAIDDSLPKTPENVSWVATGNDFTGRWSSVTKNIANKDITVVRYEIRLTAGNGDIRRDSVTAGSDDIGVYNLSHSKNRNLFGNARRNISFEVRAVDNKDAKSAWSTPINVNINDPQPVTNVSVTAGIDQLIVKWDSSTSADVARYDVHVGTAANFAINIGNRFFQGFTNVATYTTGTYIPHYVAVVAVDAMGLTSAPVYAGPATPESPFVLDTAAPSVPAALNVTASTGAPPIIATATWTFDATAAGNTDVSGFLVKWNKAGDAATYNIYVDKASRSTTVELPTPYADYEFKIASIDGVGNESAFSPVYTLSNSVPGPPPTPTGITATPGYGTIAFKWSPSTHNDVVYGGYYEFEIATNSTFTTGLLNYKTGNTYIDITGLADTTTYYYRLRAVDSTALASAFSATASATTTAFPVPDPSDGVPPASSPTPVVTPGIGYLQVRWPATVNNDLVTYEVHISPTTGFTPSSTTKAAEITGTTTVLRTDAAGTALTYGTIYYVKIIAKDVDGAAAASAQASGAPAKTGTFDVDKISVANLDGGTVAGEEIILGTGGIFRSANYNATNKTGFSLTESSLILHNGTVNAAALESGSTITANLSVTGNMTISSAGTIKSSNYASGTAGFSLSATGLDVGSGTVNASVLKGGTVSATTINIGATGTLNVDATGAIKSNNYAAGSTGWKLDSAGLELNQGTLRAVNIVSPTITAGGTTINSSGISGSGFSLSGSALSITSGVINGPAVYTNTLRSNTTNALTTSGYNFSINTDGGTEIAELRVYGNTRVGNSDSNWIQSGNWVAGSAGWRLLGNGSLELNGGSVNGASIRTSVTATGHHAILAGTNGIGYLNFVYNSTGMGGIGAATALNDGLIIYGQNGILGVGRIEMRNGVIDFYGNVNFQGNNLYSVGTIGAGGTVNVDTNINMTGTGRQITNVLLINGGPTINGTVIMGSLADGASNNTNTGGKYVRATPNGTLHAHTTAPSSRDIKHDISPLVMDYKKILSLEPVTFRYNWNPEDVRIGFIAENARDLGLDLLTSYEDPENSDKVTGFDYDGFDAALLLIAQEQEKRIQDLEQRLKALEGGTNGQTTNN